MKILFVNTSISMINGGGNATRTLQMSIELTNRNHKCNILCLEFEPNEYFPNFFSNANIELTSLKILYRRFYIFNPFSITIFRKVKDAELIHLIGHWTLLNCWIYLLAKVFKKKYVVCTAGALKIQHRSKFLKKIYNFIIGRKIIRDANAVIIIANNEIPQVELYKVDKSKVILIPNGIHKSYATEKQEPQNKEFQKLNSSKKFILFIGRMNLIKGPDLLFDAFCKIASSFPDYDLVLAGPDEGMTNPLILKSIEKNLSERIHFTGKVDAIQKDFLYSHAKVFVIPSRYDAMSVVILEAGLHSLPVLATTECGLDLFEKSGTILLTAPVNDKIAEALLLLLKNTELTENLGKKLSSFVQKNYSWENIGNEIESLFLEVIKN